MRKRTLNLFIPLLAAPGLVAADNIRVDVERNIYVPDYPNSHGTLQVAAAYNDDEIQIHYVFETDNPSWYHQYWRYEDGEWVRYGSGGPKPDPHGLYEDRISMLLDDGAVDGFDRYGGWMTAHDGMRSLTSEAESSEVEAHPTLGDDLGRSDVRKYLPQTRDVDDPTDVSWDAVRDDDELAQLQEDGVFLDLWQWRAHRSHPMGYADNGYVLHYRLSSEGDSMFTTNWDDDGNHPAYMFDPDETGRVALDWDELVDGEYSQDDPYFISEHNSVPFDPNHDWQEGDVIPQRFLQEPSGSRGAIRAEGGYEDGAWRVTLTRSLDAPDAMDSKTLEDGGLYNVAFAVHTGGFGARWHLVSLPQTLGLGADDEDVDIQAVHVDGDLADADLEWTELTVFHPGQITWQFLHSEDHPGQDQVREGLLGVRDHHVIEELRQYIIKQELAR